MVRMAEEPSAEMEAQAVAAGLRLALSEFHGYIAAAAASALDATRALKLPADPAAEPWPPMQTGMPA